MHSRPFRVLGLALIFLFLAIGAFWRIIFRGEEYTFYTYDNCVQVYAWYHYLINCFREGVFPLWDAHQYGGHTFIGEMQSGAFYPLNILIGCSARWACPSTT